jgi:imidazolonepropionase-like amidohydrolase
VSIERLTSSHQSNDSDLFDSGSDAAGPAVGTAWGLSIHHELFLFVRHCNFSPAEALRAATYLTAKRFGFADRGEIKVGLKADLVLVEGNPMEDIDHTLNLRGVWKDGVLCKTYEGIV